jgi:hypothetical protein
VKVAAVMPIAKGREENVRMVLKSMLLQRVKHDLVVLVYDGADVPRAPRCGLDVIEVWMPKHEPGDEQPRNIGVRTAVNYDPEITHVHFVDSDVLLDHCAVDDLKLTATGYQAGAVIAPYEWLAPGARAPELSLHNDPRWAMFDMRATEGAIKGDLSVGLGCFSGNLLWKVSEFERVGGFWAELHHGRCEDGELGARAVSMDVGIAMAPSARGWHLHHPIDYDAIMARNARDVPMLNARHPWIEGAGIFEVERDGKAFDVHCKFCGEDVPTGAWWAHCEASDHAQDLRVVA